MRLRNIRTEKVLDVEVPEGFPFLFDDHWVIEEDEEWEEVETDSYPESVGYKHIFVGEHKIVYEEFDCPRVYKRK